jgi:hypothetical protein
MAHFLTVRVIDETMALITKPAGTQAHAQNGPEIGLQNR